MRRILRLGLILCLLLGAAGGVHATFCALDQVPAASLLYPFVMFDYNDPNNTTLFSISNMSAQAQIVHITLWSDYGQAVLSWNQVLSGYDVQTFNLRDILLHGELPASRTSGDGAVSGAAQPLAASPVNDPFAGLGQPQATSTLGERCNDNNDTHSYPDYPGIPQSLVNVVRQILQTSQVVDRAHTPCHDGDPADSWFVARSREDPTWMYITADVVWTCTRVFPDTSPEYWRDAAANPDFDGNGPQAMFDNVLAGDIFYINDSKNFSEAMLAVHLEADQDLLTNPVSTIAADGDPITFYHQDIRRNGSEFAPDLGDYREPLATAWGVRYIHAGAAMTTNLRVFKRGTLADLSMLTGAADSFPADYAVGHTSDIGLPGITDPDPVDPFSYPEPPTSMIAQDCRPYTLYMWDEDEEPAVIAWEDWLGNILSVNLFPLQTQEVNIEQLGGYSHAGWMLLIWPGSNVDDLTDDHYQTFVSVQYGAHGRFSAALPGAVAGNHNCFADHRLPDLGINTDLIPPGPVGD